jgi:ADP-ribose pyrophosphatase YjhB (NUDIX family)
VTSREGLPAPNLALPAGLVPAAGLGDCCAALPGGRRGVDLQRAGAAPAFKHTYRRDAPWGLPGGHLEFGEDPSEAVRRELLEETGFSVRATELLMVEGSHEVRKVILTYLCSDASGAFIPNEEVTQIQYFDLAALPPFRSEEQKTVEKALAILKKSNRSEAVYVVE